MKIVEQSLDKMVLLNYELVRFFFGIGSILIGIALGVAIIFGYWQNLIAIFLDCFLFIAGVYHFISYRRVLIVLDKTQAKATIVRKGLLGQQEENYDLSQISQVRLHENWISGGKVLADNYQLVFIMKNGDEVALDHPASMSRTSYKYIPSDDDRRLGQEISVFLGVVFQDEGGKNRGSGILPPVLKF